MEKRNEFAKAGPKLIAQNASAAVHPLSGADRETLKAVYPNELGRGETEIVATRPLQERTVDLKGITNQAIRQ